ncbi:MAG TPA: hypothetical protein VGR82_17565 [Methylomirabilota bacterium]|jgi:hypothetical protein|nr:hypothetical protein [Methylomirabilota bacterium]
MATLSSIHPTLLDLAQVLGPDNKIAAIIEILNQTNEVLDDFVMIEGNLLTGHQTTVRTGIPAPTWRKLYGGVQPTKSTSVKVTDSCGMCENYAEVDKALADLNGNSAAFRLSENRPILEGFNQEIVSSLFYANEDTEPEAFTGLAPRFNTTSGVENAQNIIKAGGAGADNTSVWLVVWGENTVHGIYPKGSVGGFQMNDKGQVTIENVDGNGGRMEAYRTHYRWDCGLTVRDWRYVVRVANIDLSDLTKTGATGADLIDLMTQALELVQSLNMGKPAFYANRTVKSFLRRQITNKVASSTLQMEQVAGKHVMTFDGVPVRRCDGLVNNEALVP